MFLAAPDTAEFAGYDPAGLVRYLQGQQIDRTDRPNMFSPFPPRDKRVAALEELIRELPAQAYSSFDEYKRVREEAHGLTEKRTWSPLVP